MVYTKSRNPYVLKLDLIRSVLGGQGGWSCPPNHQRQGEQVLLQGGGYGLRLRPQQPLRQE